MGRFYEPTVIANVHQGMKCQMSQTFGPLVGIQAVDSPGEAARIINSHRYGLESYVFSVNEQTISQLCQSLDVGTVHVNDVPLVDNDRLPVTGRGRSSKVFKGCSRHVLRRYCNIKSLNVVHWH